MGRKIMAKSKKPQNVDPIMHGHREYDNDLWRSKWALGFWSIAAAVCLIISIGAINFWSATKSGDYVAGLENAPKTVGPSNDKSRLDYGTLDPTLTASTKRNASPSDVASLTTAISSLQRQINTLNARNDRLEELLQDRNRYSGDSIVTGSVKPSGDGSYNGSANMSAANAMQSLELAESRAQGTEIASIQNSQRKGDVNSVGVDLGTGISFDALRDRWNSIAANNPDITAGLEARAVLRESANGMQAHLIVGPFPSSDTANQICNNLSLNQQAACRPTTFEGQRL